MQDKHELLCGTGKLIRHIKVKDRSDYRNANVGILIKEAISIAKVNFDPTEPINGYAISKIKTSIQ